MGELNVESRTLFIADNLEILRGINSESIDLIATDPPFNKGVKAFEGIVTAGVDKRGQKVKYKDVWTWGDVQAEWTESIREDHPKLHSVIQAANGAAGEDMGAFTVLAGGAGIGDAPGTETDGVDISSHRPYGPCLRQSYDGCDIRAGELQECDCMA